MNHLQKKKSDKSLGKSPGTIVYTGDSVKESVKMRLLCYDKNSVEVFESVSLKKFPKIPKGKKYWLQVDGVHDVTLIRALGEIFEIHPLFLEDVCQVNHQTNLEVIEPFVSVNLRYLELKREAVLSRHVTFLRSLGGVITFQESVLEDCFLVIEKRLLDPRDLLRMMGSAYLHYTLIDLVVDHYLDILEMLEEGLETLEDRIYSKTLKKDLFEDLHRLRKNFLVLQKPLTGVHKMLEVFPSKIKPQTFEETKIYFQDLGEHVRNALEMVYHDLDRLSGLFDLHLSSLSLRMNEAMRCMAVITVWFLPLAFFTGVFGMNFRHIPGLDWPHAFWIVMIVMGFLSFGILRVFKQKRWF